MIPDYYKTVLINGFSFSLSDIVLITNLKIYKDNYTNGKPLVVYFIIYLKHDIVIYLKQHFKDLEEYNSTKYNTIDLLYNALSNRRLVVLLNDSVNSTPLSSLDTSNIMIDITGKYDTKNKYLRQYGEEE